MVWRKEKVLHYTWLTLKWGFLGGIVLAFLILGLGYGYVSAIAKDMKLEDYTKAAMEEKIGSNEETSFAYFRDKRPMGQLRTNEDRRLVKYEDLNAAPRLIKALISIEDNNFYKHIGIDFTGFLRAIKQKVLKEDVQTGGSTLTQQLTRRVFLNLDKTTSRKIKEIILSIRLEQFLTKQEILTAYLNKVPFGNGAQGYNLYGIKAASLGLFGIGKLEKLNDAQVAYLVGLPQLPSRYSAFSGNGTFKEKSFKLAIQRQQLVLRRMFEEKQITKQEYDAALAFDLKGSLQKSGKKAYATYPYLMLETERAAAEALVLQRNPQLKKEDLENQELISEAIEEIQTRGYHIYTTIDKGVYDTMHEVVANKKNFSPDDPEKGVEQIAGMLINHHTGEILGMLEGRDFHLEQMNYATQMTRQPGSSMKPLAAFLPALEAGLIQPASILDDAPIVLKDGSKGFHIPVNYNKKYNGLITARESLNKSLNMPALKIFLDKVGIKDAWNFVRSLGITTIQPEDDYAQTGVLGGLKYGVTVEEITNAYGSIANKGVLHDAYTISKIENSKGEVVFEHEVEEKKVFSEQTAYLMTDMLKTTISSASGTGRSLKKSFKKYGKIDIAGKTGSTSNYADVWFLGFTPDVTLGVWSGYKTPKHTLSKEGQSRALKIWAEVMSKVTEKYEAELFPTKTFEQPSGIVKATVSGFSGKLPNEYTLKENKLNTDIFNQKFVPTEEEDGIGKMRVIKYNGINYIAKDGTPTDMVTERVVIKREKPLQDLMEEIKKALEIMPEKYRRPLESYLPADADLDSPSKEDPREDDGSNPPPPSSSIQVNQGNVTITFNDSSADDVVGYRLYKSDDGEHYQYVGPSIVTGDSRTFTSSGGNSYYVAAVDVSGKESGDNQILYVNGPPEDPSSNENENESENNESDSSSVPTPPKFDENTNESSSNDSESESNTSFSEEETEDHSSIMPEIPEDSSSENQNSEDTTALNQPNSKKKDYRRSSSLA